METLNVGAIANDKTGDKGRDAFVKIKNNFSELDKRVPLPSKFEGVTSNYELLEWLPDAGTYHLERITFKNSTENVGQISAGTTSNGNDIFSQLIINPMGGESGINPEGWTTIETRLIASASNPVSIFFNTSQGGDEWNGVSLDIFLTLRRIA